MLSNDDPAHSPNENVRQRLRRRCERLQGKAFKMIGDLESCKLLIDDIPLEYVRVSPREMK